MSRPGEKEEFEELELQFLDDDSDETDQSSDLQESMNRLLEGFDEMEKERALLASQVASAAEAASAPQAYKHSPAHLRTANPEILRQKLLELAKLEKKEGLSQGASASAADDSEQEDDSLSGIFFMDEELELELDEDMRRVDVEEDEINSQRRTASTGVVTGFEPSSRFRRELTSEQPPAAQEMTFRRSSSEFVRQQQEQRLRTRQSIERPAPAPTVNTTNHPRVVVGFNPKKEEDFVIKR